MKKYKLGELGRIMIGTSYAVTLPKGYAELYCHFPFLQVPLAELGKDEIRQVPLA